MTYFFKNDKIKTEDILENIVDKNGEPVYGRLQWSNGSIVEITRNGKILNVPNNKY